MLSYANCEITDKGLIAFLKKIHFGILHLWFVVFTLFIFNAFLYDYVYIYTPKIYLLFGSLFPLLLLSTYI